MIPNLSSIPLVLSDPIFRHVATDTLTVKLATKASLAQVNAPDKVTVALMMIKPIIFTLIKTPLK
jgi:hypothetical protein